MFSFQKEKDQSNTRYPSAELLQQACYQDYSGLRNTYDFIYNKVQIALAFSTALLVVIIQNIELKFWFNLGKGVSCYDKVMYTIISTASVLSVAAILVAIIKLLLLSKSKRIVEFDSIGIRTEEIYKDKPNDAALWLISKYTTATNELRIIIDTKQKQFNGAVDIIILSIALYIVSVIVKKGA